MVVKVIEVTYEDTLVQLEEQVEAQRYRILIGILTFLNSIADIKTVGTMPVHLSRLLKYFLNLTIVGRVSLS